MLRFRLKYLLELKGIHNPYNFLIRHGLTANVATRSLNGKIEQLKLSHINRICKTLNCTPNDLLEWYPGKEESLPDNHRLSELIRNDKPFNIIGKINNLTIDQIKEVEQLIARMNSAGNNPDSKTDDLK